MLAHRGEQSPFIAAQYSRISPVGKQGAKHPRLYLDRKDRQKTQTGAVGRATAAQRQVLRICADIFEDHRFAQIYDPADDALATLKHTNTPMILRACFE